MLNIVAEIFSSNLHNFFFFKIEKSMQKNASRGTWGMLPWKIFENLNTAVCNGRFSTFFNNNIFMQILLKFFAPNSECLAKI